jgi:DNA-binding beta-propeller fold protein YncE
VVLGVAPNIGVWTATTNAAWLHLSSAYQSGVGSTNVVFSFDANPGPTRSGALVINGQTLTITQAGSTYVPAQPLTTLVSAGVNQPGGVAVDGAGNVYMADTDNNAIEEWIATNNTVVTLVSSGLNRPQSVAVDGAGNVYIADTQNNAIKRWTAANSNVTTLVSSGLNQPQGVAVDNLGNVYIADTFNSAVKEWTAASNNAITLVASGLVLPVSVAVDSAQNVYIADTGHNAIEEWNAANGAIITLVSPPPGYLTGVAVDGGGNIYFADASNSFIAKWTAVSNTLSKIVPSGINSPYGLAVDSRRNLYLADTGDNAVKEMPYAFVDPTPRFESPNAGYDGLPAVVPSTESFLAPFTPASDQSWLTNSFFIYDGMVYFSFSANEGLSRTAHIGLFGQEISITQAAADVAPLVFLPPSGTGLTNGSLISISCATPGAVIYFATNGSPASTNSAVYSTPFIFNDPGPFTINALAIADQYTGSSSATATYSFPQVAAPALSPPFGPITNGTAISMSCATPGAQIYYTLDGSIPSTNSTPYAVPPVIGGGVTVSAYAVATAHIGSPVTSVTYNQAQIGMPQFTPSQGPVTNGTLISTTSTNPSAIIYYTVDGSTPTTNSTIYTAPILFTNQFTLQAQVFASGYLPSIIASNFYGLLDAIPNVAVTTFAGSPVGGLLDGMGVAARFSYPEGICIDTNGDLFVSDYGNNCIRKILPTGQVITYAGNGTITNSTSPSATNAFFSEPVGICLDAAGNLYVADNGNSRICKIGTDGSFAVYAHIHSGMGQLIADPAGNLYLGAWAEAYKILTNGSVQALAGTGCACPGGWSVSVGLALDAATNLYAATGYDIWKIPPGGRASVVTGGPGQQMSDGVAAEAGFSVLTGATIDNAGNIYLSDSVRIRKLSPSGWVSTVAGTGVLGYGDGPGTAAQFNGIYPPFWSINSHMGICLDAAGNLYVSDTANNCVRKVSFNTVALPPLQINQSTNLISVTWPTWASNFVLESSGTVSSGGSWGPVTNGGTTLQGGQNLWTNQVGNGELFFRLHKP